MKSKTPSAVDRYKIVFCGPGLAGKRTNIEQLRRRVLADGDVAPAEASGPILTAGVQDEKLFRKKLLLNTVADVPTSMALWSTVLRGAHGIIFVADSDCSRYHDNIQAMSDVIAQLSSFRTKIDQFPFVIQYNKRDLELAVPILKFEDELNPLGLPAFNAVAREGKGVIECLQAINLLIEKSARADLITLG